MTTDVQDPTAVETPVLLDDQAFQVAGLPSAISRAIRSAGTQRVVPKRAKGPRVTVKEAPQNTPEVPDARPIKPKEPSLDAERVADEADRIGSLEFPGRQISSETHQVNFDTIQDTDDVKALIADMAEANKGRINAARRNKITNEQMRALANDLDVETDVVQAVMTRETGGILNGETILAARDVLAQSADRIVSLAKRVREGEASDLEKLQFRRQLDFHREFQTGFMGARAEVGRALNTFNIPIDKSPDSMARVSELVDGFYGDTVQIAQALEGVTTTQGISKVAKNYQRSKVAGAMQELWINSILSGAKTQVVNMTGNALFQVMGVAETAMAARLGRFLSGEEHVLIGEASAKLYAMTSGFRDAMRLAYRTLRTGETLDSVNKLEQRYPRAISAEALEMSGTMGRVADFLGAVVRFPTERVMAGADEFFKSLAYRSSLAEQAYRGAMKERVSRGLSDEQTADLVRAYMENPPAEAVTLANAEALYRTFQNPLGKTGRDIQGVVSRSPGLKYLAPFIRTPTNIFKAGIVERSPLGLFSKRIREEIAAGGPRRDLALARISMGTMTVASIAVMAGSGMITGGGPSNPQARKTLQATGWKPYSLVIPNPVTGKMEYHSYQRAEPLAFVIGATADAVEIMRYADATSEDELKDFEDRASTIAASIIAGVAENTMSKTYLRGLSEFAEVTSDPQRYFQRWSANITKGFVPFSAALRDVKRTIDPNVRESFTMIEQWKKDLPYFSDDLPMKRNLYGDPVLHPSGEILGVLSPFPDQEQTTDRVRLEVANVMSESRTVPITMPHKRIEGKKLNVHQYDKLVRLSRQEIEINGMTFHEALERVMDDPLYAEAPVDLKAALLKDVQKGFDDQARQMLVSEDDEFRMKLNRHRALKLREKYGEQAVPGEFRDLLGD